MIKSGSCLILDQDYHETSGPSARATGLGLQRGSMLSSSLCTPDFFPGSFAGSLVPTQKRYVLPLFENLLGINEPRLCRNFAISFGVRGACEDTLDTLNRLSRCLSYEDF